MNIDILFSRTGEAGLIANENFPKKMAGVLIDTSTGAITIEYVDSDHLDMNIPLDLSLAPMFDSMMHIHVGAVKAGQIGQGYQVPIMIADDPYRGEMLAQIPTPSMPLSQFAHFIKKAMSGQPIHREDLGDETTTGCILGDAVPSTLQFAPHLAKRQSLEASPQMAPKGPAPSAPGLGLGGGTGTSGSKKTGDDNH